MGVLVGMNNLRRSIFQVPVYIVVNMLKVMGNDVCKGTDVVQDEIQLLY